MASTSNSTTRNKLGENNSSTKFPQSAETIKQMIYDAGILEYEPQLVLQVCDVAYSLTKQILVEARSVSEFCGKKLVDNGDVEFALKAFSQFCVSEGEESVSGVIFDRLTPQNSSAVYEIDQIQIFVEEKYAKDRPPKSFLAELSAEKNSRPLPPIRQNYGLRLPSDRFCQLQPNYEHVGADEESSRRPVEALSTVELRRRATPNENSFNADMVSNLMGGGSQGLMASRKRAYQEDDEKPDEGDEDYD